MSDNLGYTPGSGATVASDDIGGIQHQRVKLTMGPDGVSQGDAQGANYDPVGTELGLLVRQIGEDNAYTQELLNNISQVLRSVWQMGSAAGQPSITVRNPTLLDFQATVNASQFGGTTPAMLSGFNSSPSTATTAAALAVAPTQAYHPPSLSQHIYGNIQV